MKNFILILTVVFLGTFSANIYAYREPTKPPPLSVYSGGKVGLSPEFIEYLIHVKNFQSQYEVFRTVQNDLPTIQKYAQDFLNDGSKKIAEIIKKNDMERKKKWAQEEEQAKIRQKNRILEITGKEFILLCDYESVNFFKREVYLNYLKRNLIEGDKAYELQEGAPSFCYKRSFAAGPEDEEIMKAAKKILKKNGLLKNEDFLNGSAAQTVQRILIKKYPCYK